MAKPWWIWKTAEDGKDVRRQITFFAERNELRNGAGRRGRKRECSRQCSHENICQRQ